MTDETTNDETTEALLEVIFTGAAADQPVRGNFNGVAYEYPLNVPVAVPAERLAVIEAAGYTCERTAQPEPEPEGAAPAGDDAEAKEKKPGKSGKTGAAE